MNDEVETLKFVCKKLEDAQVPYMLTGSLAANYYATPRMTRDLDIVVELYNLDINKFMRVFQKDFYVMKESILEAVMHQSMFNLIHNDYLIKVDFIIRKDSEYRKTEFQRKRRLDIGDQQIWVVSPEDLIISKLYWAKESISDLQIKDVNNIMSSIKNLDNEYLHKWIHILELNAIFERVKING